MVGVWIDVIDSSGNRYKFFLPSLPPSIHEFTAPPSTPNTMPGIQLVLSKCLLNKCVSRMNTPP